MTSLTSSPHAECVVLRSDTPGGGKALNATELEATLVSGFNAARPKKRDHQRIGVGTLVRDTSKDSLCRFTGKLPSQERFAKFRVPLRFVLGTTILRPSLVALSALSPLASPVAFDFTETTERRPRPRWQPLPALVSPTPCQTAQVPRQRMVDSSSSWRSALFVKRKRRPGATGLVKSKHQELLVAQAAALQEPSQDRTGLQRLCLQEAVLLNKKIRGPFGPLTASV